MKKSLLLLVLIITGYRYGAAQVLCIQNFEQNDSVGKGVHNLVLNGSFENSSCNLLVPICPNAHAYGCDVDHWVCTGGDSLTYACVYDSVMSTVVQGSRVLYFGNHFCSVCNSQLGDTSCLGQADCLVTGIPAGYPVSEPYYGGATGVSLSQAVHGLVPGNIYILEFWAGGEFDVNQFFNSGVFAVDIGFGNMMLRCKPTPSPSTGTRYVIKFRATSATHTIKFTNWGHICHTCTELVADDVRLYSFDEFPTTVPMCIFAIKADSTISKCRPCTGTATARAAYGVTPFSYLWSNGGTTQTISNLCPGKYTVTATDATGATAIDSTTVIEYPVPANIYITTADTSLCYSDSSYTCASFGYYYNYLWSNGETGMCIYAKQPGNYSVVVTDSNNCSALSNSIHIIRLQPPVVSITADHYTLSVFGPYSAQWFLDGNPIPGATSSTYEAYQPGFYTVQVTDSNGCTSTSSPINLTGINDVIPDRVLLYPDPSASTVYLETSADLRGATWQIFDAGGSMVYNGTVTTDKCELPLNLQRGVYMLRITTPGKCIERKFTHL